MGVGWFDQVSVNRGIPQYFCSKDDRHNGVLTSGGVSVNLDDGEFHELSPNTKYTTEQCAIPWYYKGEHYKAVSNDKVTGVLFYTSEMDGQNWIIFEDIKTLRRLGKQAAPSSDFHCNLRIADASGSYQPGVFIDIVNETAYSGANALFEIDGEVKRGDEGASQLARLLLKALEKGEN